MFDRIATTLTSAHIDFDYGDEEIISRRGEIVETGGEPAFKIARGNYKAVLVPPLKTIRSTTLELLQKFREAGGLVVFAGEPPGYVDALPSEKPGKFVLSCPRVASIKDAPEAVGKRCKHVSITDPDGDELKEIIYLLKEDENAYYLFIANTGYLPEKFTKDVLAREREVSHPEVFIAGFRQCKGAPVELDVETGRRFTADASQNEDGWVIKTSLPRIKSRVFLVPKENSNQINATPRRKLTEVSSEELNPAKWDLSLSEDNCLVLDRPHYRIGDGDWQDPEEVLRIDCRIRDALGLDHRGGRMVQPWAREKTTNPRCIPVHLRYDFEVKHIPAGEMRLAVESPDVFDISINGTPIRSESANGWWVDRSLETLPIDPALLKTGMNKLELRLDYLDDFSGLEIVYILGEFGTQVDGTSVSITPPPESLKLGDWCEQGLNFYAGSACYRYKIRPEIDPGQRLFVCLDNYRGIAMRVLINGKPAGMTAWEPNEIDITDFIDTDREEIELGLEIIGHRRNSHGPLHITEKWPSWTGPGEFITTENRWQDNYQLVPAGLMTPPRLSVRE